MFIALGVKLLAARRLKKIEERKISNLLNKTTRLQYEELKQFEWKHKDTLLNNTNPKLIDKLWREFATDIIKKNIGPVRSASNWKRIWKMKYSRNLKHRVTTETDATLSSINGNGSGANENNLVISNVITNSIENISCNCVTDIMPSQIKQEEIIIKQEPQEDPTWSEKHDIYKNSIECHSTKNNITYISSDTIPMLTPIPGVLPPPLAPTKVIPTLRWFENKPEETVKSTKEGESTNSVQLQSLLENDEPNSSEHMKSLLSAPTAINQQDIEALEYFKTYFPFLKLLKPAQKLKVGIKIHQAFLSELQDK